MRRLINMFNCKLCLSTKADEERSKAEKHTCRECWADISFYKRNMSNAEFLDVHKWARFNTIKQTLEASKARGGFVPGFFGAVLQWYSCGTCDKNFEAASQITLCNACKSREISYKQLLKLNDHMKHGSRKLLEHIAYYNQKEREGKHVPEFHKVLRRKLDDTQKAAAVRTRNVHQS
jgi:hypothetical protein